MYMKYSLKESGGDCLMTFKFPTELCEAVAVRAKVFGRSFETEMKLRLLRSLSKDELRDKTDELLEAIYYSEES